jgi:S-adenosyl methyltransferase
VVEPGIVPRQDWRPDAEVRAAASNLPNLPSLAGVARKP